MSWISSHRRDLESTEAGFRALPYVSGTGGTGFEREYEKRFLAGLLLVLIPLSAVVGMLVLPRWLAPQDPRGTSTFQAAAVFTSVLSVAAVLNHVGRYRWASSLTVVAVLGATFWASFDHAHMVMFVLIGVLTATALFSPGGAALVGLAGLSAAPLLLLDPTHRREDIVFAASFNATLIALLFVVRYHHLRLERRRRQEIAWNERWFSTTLRSIGDGVLTADTTGRVTFMNTVATDLTGWSLESAQGRAVEEVFDIVNEETGDPVESPVRKVLREGVVVGLANHTVLISKSGLRYPISDSGAPIVEPSGELHGVVLVFRDMSHEQSISERLQEAQRLESLGRLAGGVAHDFNNLLTVIRSTAQLAQSEAPAGSRANADLDNLLQATDCAVSLTRQLLAFSSRQVMRRRVVRIDDAVADAQRLFERLLRDDVRLETDLRADGVCVFIDPTQLEQVLVNLAINAADAMPHGGSLTIETARVDVAHEEDEIAPAGSYARVRVTDTGCGMDEKTRAQVFEPFFTTKEAGRGTGLGLSTVHGIVRQIGGHVSVESRVGEGTTFTVLLPRSDLEEDRGTATRHQEPLVRPSVARTVYLVEDDAMVRALAGRILEPLGYRVRAFGGGAEVLERFDAQPEVVDLLLTDVVMPGMSGPEVSQALRARIPELRVVFMSGYADEVVAREGMSGPECGFVEKPFTPRSLTEAVRSILEGQGGS